jgi:hypothetical protein
MTIQRKWLYLQWNSNQKGLIFLFDPWISNTLLSITWKRLGKVILKVVLPPSCFPSFLPSCPSLWTGGHVVEHQNPPSHHHFTDSGSFAYLTHKGEQERGENMTLPSKGSKTLPGKQSAGPKAPVDNRCLPACLPACCSPPSLSPLSTWNVDPNKNCKVAFLYEYPPLPQFHEVQCTSNQLFSCNIIHLDPKCVRPRNIQSYHGNERIHFSHPAENARSVITEKLAVKDFKDTC